jgi:hypothetical protein
MNLESQIRIDASGTSEGVMKAWDTRGRKAKELVESAGYKATLHRNETSQPGVRLAIPNGVTTYVHPDGRRVTIAMGPTSSNTWAHQSASGKVVQGKNQNTDVLKALVGKSVKAGQSDSSSFIGRKYRVTDTKYGHSIGEYDDPETAEHAARTRPYSKVTSWPQPENSQKLRDIARKRQVKTNPDIDS